MKGATAIVVGGGILGATTACELARGGLDVLLLEAGRFGEQSTGKSAAIVRCHYSNPEVVRMALRSRETLRRLPLLLECDPVYTRCGWLFLVDEESAAVALANAEMQDEEGLETYEVLDLQQFLPGAEEAGIGLALHEPDAGFADPVATTNAYVEALKGFEGRALEGTPVEQVVVEGDRVRGVRVAGELVECDSLVLAAGPWTLKLAADIGLELPLEITREQDVVFETTTRARPPVRGLLADRPGLHAARARARRGAPARRAGIPEGVRDRRSGGRSTTRSTRSSSRTCTSAWSAGYRTWRECAGSAARSASTT